MERANFFERLQKLGATTPKQIAELLGCTTRTVYNIQHRGRTPNRVLMTCLEAKERIAALESRTLK